MFSFYGRWKISQHNLIETHFILCSNEIILMTLWGTRLYNELTGNKLTAKETFTTSFICVFCLYVGCSSWSNAKKNELKNDLKKHRLKCPYRKSIHLYSISFEIENVILNSFIKSSRMITWWLFFIFPLIPNKYCFWFSILCEM